MSNPRRIAFIYVYAVQTRRVCRRVAQVQINPAKCLRSSADSPIEWNSQGYNKFLWLVIHNTSAR